MKKIFLFAVAAFMFLACGNRYIDGYETLCEEAKKRLEKVKAEADVIAVMKDFKAGIRELGEDFPEDMSLCASSKNEDGSANELYVRRVKAHNSVSRVAATKWREFKQKR